jgi:hypothetical protein
MPRLLPRILAVLLLLAPLAADTHAQSRDARFATDEEAVRFTFERYRNAILARDGETAYDCVDENTRRYYARIMDHVKYDAEDALRELSFTDLTIILAARQFIAQDTLATMDGRDLFVHAVDNGWTDREIVVASLGPVEFSDGAAHAPALVNRRATLFHWVFHFEDGRWRLDLATQLAAIDDASRQMLASEGLEPADLAYGMLVRGAGADIVSPEIWNPPFTR